jgi:hypothetical protein
MKKKSLHELIQKKSEKSIILNELCEKSISFFIHEEPKADFLFTRKIRLFLCLG